MKTIGRHLIADFYGCDPQLLDDLERIERTLLAAATAIGAHILGSTFHRLEPHGVSGAVVVSESHLSIHTWPETAYVAADIYTCGSLDPRDGLTFLAEALASQRWRMQEILRGLPEELPEVELEPKAGRICYAPRR